MNILSTAIKNLGGYSATARVCGLTYKAICRWETQARLPYSDHLGSTHYAANIAAALNDAITEQELLQWSLANWRKKKA